ncbi:2-oxoisovalerate dehydrogenase subunit alpha, mitochondrial [Mucor velutinosus]|uniref:2-oxoisovalerate dehydrogenase subunit alpha, mitochondrial n=1 Tax=Mucor velutinosus TaxID=708070 RepID=A0AAN7D2Z6_9FUNG|nr:2-oxoisovalerate dehydrogenase subunit alpha, mitochondrial [Mucor velutinosus]
MGNVISSQKHRQLKAKSVEEAGFENYTEVSSCHLGGSIEVVTDESCGDAANLLKMEKANRQLNLDDFNEATDGWLTKRHESVGSVTITLCNESKIAGLDIDTTGYTDCCPSFANVEGYQRSSMTWQVILAESRINADSHNFYDVKDSNVYSSVRLNIAPGGGVARFRVYGELSPDWSDRSKDYNLASAKLGARIVRWTDQRSANNPNILLDGGTKMSDGWLTPRSKLEKERNDFVLVQLATAGALESIVIDTTGFAKNSPANVFIQGCCSEDVDPHYDVFASWVCLVPLSPVLAGGETTFYLSNVKDPITHIRMHLIPDGGIQQIKVMGKPAVKETKQQLLIEQAPEVIVIEQDSEEDDDTLSLIVEEILDTPVIEQLSTVKLCAVNQPPSSPTFSRGEKRARKSASTSV